jgi:hypothetical protein
MDTEKRINLCDGGVSERLKEPVLKTYALGFAGLRRVTSLTE